MSFTLTIDRSELAVEPGSRATFGMSVTNTGTVVDEISFTVLGDAAPWVTVDPAAVRLFPGDQTQVTVTVEPPRTPDAPAGVVPLGVIGRSGQSDETMVVELDVTVGGYTTVEASVRPRRVTGGRLARYRVTLENRGNQTATVRLDASDEDDRLLLSVSPDDLSVPAGSAEIASVRARPVRRPVFGAPQERPFEILVAPSGQPPIRLNAAFQVTPAVPRWALRTVMVLAVVGVALTLVRAQSGQVESQALRAQPIDFVSEAPLTPPVADPAVTTTVPEAATTTSPDGATTTADPVTTTSDPTTSTTSTTIGEVEVAVTGRCQTTGGGLGSVTTTTAGAEDDEGDEGGQVEENDGVCPGVHGGTEGRAACDVDAYVNHVAGDATKTSVLASFFGLADAQLEEALRSLTPVQVAADTWVVDHDFVNGGLERVGGLLQAGSAVLVDARGSPRVRCVSGSPLAPPPDTDVTLSVSEENRWPSIADGVQRAQVVQPGDEPVRDLVLVDAARIGTGVADDVCGTVSDDGAVRVTDACFARPVASTGAEDRPVTLDDLCFAEDLGPAEDPDQPEAAFNAITPAEYRYDVDQGTSAPQSTLTIVADAPDGDRQTLVTRYPRNFPLPFFFQETTEVLERREDGLFLVQARVADNQGGDSGLTDLATPALIAPAAPEVGDRWTTELPLELVQGFVVEHDELSGRTVTVETEVVGTDSVRVGDVDVNSFVIERRVEAGELDFVLKETRSRRDWGLVRMEIPDALDHIIVVQLRAPGSEPEDEVQPPEPPTGLGDDPALQPLAEACFDGDMTSCDDLVDGSGSAYDRYGFTCGGRLPRGSTSCFGQLGDQA